MHFHQDMGSLVSSSEGDSMPSTAQTPSSFAHIHRTYIAKSSSTISAGVLSGLMYDCDICTKESLGPIELSVAVVTSEVAVLEAWWVGGGENALWWRCYGKVPKGVEC